MFEIDTVTSCCKILLPGWHQQLLFFLHPRLQLLQLSLRIPSHWHEASVVYQLRSPNSASLSQIPSCFKVNFNLVIQVEETMGIFVFSGLTLWSVFHIINFLSFFCFLPHSQHIPGITEHCPLYHTNISQIYHIFSMPIDSLNLT